MARKSLSKQVPEIDIHRWMSAIEPQKITHEIGWSPKGTSAVIFFGLKKGKEWGYMSVWGEPHTDGVSMYFVARPNEAGTPLLHMKFKDWQPERGMAAILAVVAFHAEKPRLPKKFSMANEWLRQMRNQILKSFYHEGKSFEERGIHPVLIEMERQCRRRFLSLAGLDVKESLDRVKKEFKLLTDHVTEEDILSIWRELIVEKVLKT